MYCIRISKEVGAFWACLLSNANWYLIYMWFRLLCMQLWRLSKGIPFTESFHSFSFTKIKNLFLYLWFCFFFIYMFDRCCCQLSLPLPYSHDSLENKLINSPTVICLEKLENNINWMNDCLTIFSSNLAMNSFSVLFEDRDLQVWSHMQVSPS